MRAHYYIPLVLCVPGAAVLAIHITSALGLLDATAIQLTILACVALAGFAATARIPSPSRVPLFVATISSVVLHLILVPHWLVGFELFEGAAAPPVLLVAGFTGALIRREFDQKLGSLNFVSTAFATLMLILAGQAIVGDQWPMSFWPAVLTLFVAQTFSFIAADFPDNGPRTSEMLAVIVAGVLGYSMLTEMGFEPLNFGFGVIAIGALTMFAVAIAGITLGLLEGLGGSPSRKRRIKIPAARLIRRTW